MNPIKIIQVLYINRSNVVPILLKISNWMVVYVTKKNTWNTNYFYIAIWNLYFINLNSYFVVFFYMSIWKHIFTYRM